VALAALIAILFPKTLQKNKKKTPNTKQQLRVPFTPQLPGLNSYCVSLHQSPPLSPQLSSKHQPRFQLSACYHFHYDDLCDFDNACVLSFHLFHSVNDSKIN
jgi:hypothetical protein